MKKLFFVIGVLIIFALSSCNNDQNKFMSLDSSGLTEEQIFLVSHADSSDLLPCIVMEDYVLVIKDTDTEAQIMKVSDLSGNLYTVLIMLFAVLFLLIITLAAYLIKDNYI